MDREKIIDGLNAIPQYCELYDRDRWACDEAIKLLEQDQRTGHWVDAAIQGEIDGQIVKAFICSECGAISVFRMIGGEIVNGNLCPNCGANMEEQEQPRTFSTKIVVNGKCVICGKELNGDNIIFCDECKNRIKR